MASLVTDQGIVHYETYGRGRPVLLLHGWLGSWELWRDTIEVLGREFRTYSLDFWGFGSSKATADTFNFSVENFVELVYQFMERLGIPKAPLIGHSMGGTVSLGVAIRHPEVVVKVGVVGSPVDGGSLNPLLKLAGYPALAYLFFMIPDLVRLFLRVYSYSMAIDGQRLGRMIVSDFSQVTVKPFFESIGTLRKTDLQPRLGEIKVPTLGIYGTKDIIVGPMQHKMLRKGVPGSYIYCFDNSGHFPMMDQPEAFHETIREFLHNG